MANQICTSLIFYHVQDGGSTDGSLAILEAWQAKLADNQRVRFSYSSEVDNGMYDALNKGAKTLAIPEHAFMSWINASDLLMPGALQAIIELDLKLGSSVDWIYGIPRCLEENGKLQAQGRIIPYPQSILATGGVDGILWPFFQQEGCFFRKKLWSAVGGCNIQFRLAGDWDLWCRMATLAALVYLARQLGCFRRHGGQLSESLATYHVEINVQFLLPQEKTYFHAGMSAGTQRSLCPAQQSEISASRLLLSHSRPACGPWTQRIVFLIISCYI